MLYLCWFLISSLLTVPSIDSHVWCGWQSDSGSANCRYNYLRRVLAGFWIHYTLLAYTCIMMVHWFRVLAQVSNNSPIHRGMCVLAHTVWYWDGYYLLPVDKAEGLLGEGVWASFSAWARLMYRFNSFIWMKEMHTIQQLNLAYSVILNITIKIIIYNNLDF